MKYLESKVNKDYLTLFLAAISYSGLGIFTGILNDNSVTVFWQVFFRVTFGIIFGVLVSKYVFKIDLKFNLREAKYLFVNAILFAFGYFTISLSIYLGTPVGKAIALAFSYPLCVVVSSYLILGDKPRIRNILSVIFSIIAVGLIMKVWQIENFAQVETGDVFALLNSFAYGNIIVFGTKMKKDINFHPLKKLTLTLIFLLPLVLIIGGVSGLLGVNNLSMDPSGIVVNIETIVAIIGLAVFGTVVSNALIYQSAGKVKPNVASIILLTELIWVLLLSSLLFGEIIDAWKLSGVGLIMLSVLLI